MYELCTVFLFFFILSTNLASFAATRTCVVSMIPNVREYSSPETIRIWYGSEQVDLKIEPNPAMDNVKVTVLPKCLIMRVYEKRTRLADFLLGAYYAENDDEKIDRCPGYMGPGRNYSSWLLGLVHALNRAAGVDYCDLDDAMVGLVPSGLGNNLLTPYLRLKRGFSIYESNGFLPVVDSRKEYEKIISSQRSLEEYIQTCNENMHTRIDTVNGGEVMQGMIDKFQNIAKNRRQRRILHNYLTKKHKKIKEKVVQWLSEEETRFEEQSAVYRFDVLGTISTDPKQAKKDLRRITANNFAEDIVFMYDNGSFEKQGFYDILNFSADQEWKNEDLVISLEQLERDIAEEEEKATKQSRAMERDEWAYQSSRERIASGWNGVSHGDSGDESDHSDEKESQVSIPDSFLDEQDAQELGPAPAGSFADYSDVFPDQTPPDGGTKREPNGVASLDSEEEVSFNDEYFSSRRRRTKTRKPANGYIALSSNYRYGGLKLAYHTKDFNHHVFAAKAEFHPRIKIAIKGRKELNDVHADIKYAKFMFEIETRFKQMINEFRGPDSHNPAVTSVSDAISLIWEIYNTQEDKVYKMVLMRSYKYLSKVIPKPKTTFVKVYKTQETLSTQQIAVDVDLVRPTRDNRYRYPTFVLSNNVAPVKRTKRTKRPRRRRRRSSSDKQPKKQQPRAKRRKSTRSKISAMR